MSEEYEERYEAERSEHYETLGLVTSLRQQLAEKDKLIAGLFSKTGQRILEETMAQLEQSQIAVREGTEIIVELKAELEEVRKENETLLKSIDFSYKPTKEEIEYGQSLNGAARIKLLEAQLEESRKRLEQLEGWLNEAATACGGCDLDSVANVIKSLLTRRKLEGEFLGAAKRLHFWCRDTHGHVPVGYGEFITSLENLNALDEGEK